MIMKIKVEDDSNLVRDSINGAILNTNKKSLDDYKRNRNQKLSLQSQVDGLKNEIEQLRELINIIKDKVN